jgi:endoglycosylceramidase
MNEPFAGDVYEDPLLLIPGVADNVKLQPLYDEVNNAIREIDDKHLILFQGVTW